MKNINLLKHLLIGLLFVIGSTQVSFAQTQAEIEAMQNEEKTEKTVKDKKSKTELKAEKEVEKARKEAEKLVKKAEKEKTKTNKKVEESSDKVNEKVVEGEEQVKDAKDVIKNEENQSTEQVKDAKNTKSSVETEAESTENKVTDSKMEANNDKKVSKEEREKMKTAKRTSRSTPLKKPLKTWSIDLGLNFTNPQTDIRYNDFFGTLSPKNEFKYGGQLRITKMFDNAIGLQAQFSYNRLQGVFDTLVPFKEDREFLEAAGITEGLYFRNNVIQGSLNLYWNISNTVFNVNRYFRSANSKRPLKPRWFSIYAYSGIGIAIFDPHVMRLSDNAPVSDPSIFPGVDFQLDQTTEVVIPLALGAKFKLSKTVDLGFEYGYNFVFSDKLDGFNYNHPGRLKHDGYTYGSLVATFKLGGKKNAKEHIEWVSSVEPLFEEIAKIEKIKKKVDRLAKDADEDGISDYFDKDTETPEGAKVASDGTLLDSDSDGIPDDQDLEPFTDKDAEVDEDGKAIDTDGDGVPDHLDMEDGTSKGEFVNFQGKSIDDNITPDETKLRNLALPSIFFDTDKAVVKREYEDELFQLALTIKRNAGLKFTLEGHCDERGSEEYNIELGKRRAEAVKQYLVDNYKLDSSLFTIESKGNAEALSPRYRINRRVDIIVSE